MQQIVLPESLPAGVIHKTDASVGAQCQAGDLLLSVICEGKIYEIEAPHDGFLLALASNNAQVEPDRQILAIISEHYSASAQRQASRILDRSFGESGPGLEVCDVEHTMELPQFAQHNIEVTPEAAAILRRMKFNPREIWDALSGARGDRHAPGQVITAQAIHDYLHLGSELAILGASTDALEIIDLVESCGELKHYEMRLYDDSAWVTGRCMVNVPITGKIPDVIERANSGVVGALVIASRGPGRAALFERVFNAVTCAPILQLVHPSATVANSAILDSGTLVSAGAVVGPHAIIGAGSVIGYGAIVGALAIVGEHCCVGAGSVVETEAVVNDGAHLGPGCVIARGVQVPKHLDVPPASHITADGFGNNASPGGQPCA